MHEIVELSLGGPSGRRDTDEGPSAVHRRLTDEVTSAGFPPLPAAPPKVHEEQLARLPEPARRFMRFMGVVGRPRDFTLRVGWTGMFRLHPDKPAVACEAWQYNTGGDIARVFVMKLRMGGVLPVVGRDLYIHRHGRMLIRPLDLFTLQDAKGPELDTGELVTWLNDAVFFAPSMLLTPNVTWTEVDDRSFDVTLHDHDLAVKARIFVDERGAPSDFETTDRFLEDPYDPQRRLVRCKWTTPVDGFTEVARRPTLTAGRAIWHLPQGPYSYAELRVLPGSVAFNLLPSQV